MGVFSVEDSVILSPPQAERPERRLVCGMGVFSVEDGVILSPPQATVSS